MRVREFRWLWLAGAQSLFGDQLARVALALLVFDRTGSGADTALVYALTYLPAIIGGTVLSGLADRLPRRSLMVTCDLLRAVLVGCMALPGSPIWLLCLLLVVSVLVGAPFGSAHAALLPQILGQDRYVAGAGLRMISDQVAQVAGFAFGGALVAVIGSHWALLIDAVSFLLSAVVIRVRVAPRPPALAKGRSAERGGSTGGTLLSLWAAIATIKGDSRLWSLLGLSWLAALFVIPEGVAAPYAADIGYGATGVGLLMASVPAGQAFGSWWFVRYVGERRRITLIGPMAVLTGLPLVGCFAHPGLAVSVVLWAASGLGAAYQVQAAASFIGAVPDTRRGQIVGLASSGLIAIQGVGLLVGGVIGEQIGMSRVVAAAGLVAAIIAIPLAIACRRARSEPGESGLRRGERRSA